ncbi:MAG: hypothetical protein ACREN5_15920, partial [Gemmatimonadales bacterium]
MSSPPFEGVAGLIGLLLTGVLIYAVRQPSWIRGGIALLGLLCLLVAARLPVPPPPTPKLTGALPGDFGPAAFQQFHLNYAALLGAPVSDAAQIGDVLAQWYRFGRVEFRSPRGGTTTTSAAPVACVVTPPEHPDYPSLALAPLGCEALAVAGRQHEAGAPVPDVLQRYLEGQARDDFYRAFIPLDPTLANGSPPLVQNYGEARFKDFFDRYGSLFGEPVSPAGWHHGFVAQWYQYGRV